MLSCAAPAAMQGHQTPRWSRAGRLSFLQLDDGADGTVPAGSGTPGRDDADVKVYAGGSRRIPGSPKKRAQVGGINGSACRSRFKRFDGETAAYQTQQGGQATDGEIRRTGQISP